MWYGVLLYLLMFHSFFTVFITILPLPSLNIPSVYIQNFTFLPHNYFQLFLFLVLVKHTGRIKTILCARRKKWNNGLVVKTLNFQSRGPKFKIAVWLQGHLGLSSFRMKFLLFVWVATNKVGVTTFYIDSLIQTFVYCCSTLSTVNLLNYKRCN